MADGQGENLGIRQAWRWREVQMEAIKGQQPTVTEVLIKAMEEAEQFESIVLLYRRQSDDPQYVGSHGYKVGGCISRSDINYLLDQTKALLVRPCNGKEL